MSIDQEQLTLLYDASRETTDAVKEIKTKDEEILAELTDIGATQDLILAKIPILPVPVNSAILERLDKLVTLGEDDKLVQAAIKQTLQLQPTAAQTQSYQEELVITIGEQTDSLQSNLNTNFENLGTLIETYGDAIRLDLTHILDKLGEIKQVLIDNAIGLNGQFTTVETNQDAIKSSLGDVVTYVTDIGTMFKTSMVAQSLTRQEAFVPCSTYKYGSFSIYNPGVGQTNYNPFFGYREGFASAMHPQAQTAGSPNFLYTQGV